MKRTDDKTLISALRILARDIQSDDGIANACISEAAYRLEELTYKNLPKSERPLCEAKVYLGYGKLRQCERRCAFNSQYCHSHRHYKESSQ
ncbi:MAG: hypothetical protein R3D71_05775 [Rickettsiales bacterium]